MELLRGKALLLLKLGALLLVLLAALLALLHKQQRLKVALPGLAVVQLLQLGATLAVLEVLRLQELQIKLLAPPPPKEAQLQHL